MKRFALVMFFGLAACGSPQDDPDIQSQLSALLKDPSSVQYQKVTKNTQVVCGELNAKNSYGAYTGFRTFVFERSNKQLWLEDSDQANDRYVQFLGVMGRCENDVDLLTAKITRSSAKLH